MRHDLWHVEVGTVPLCECGIWTSTHPEGPFGPCSSASKELLERMVERMHAAGIDTARLVQGGCPAYGRSMYEENE